MKKSLLLLMMVLWGSVVYAQRLHAPDEGLDEVVLAINLNGPAMANIELKQELSLTDEQYAQVEQLNQTRYQQMQQAEKNYAQDHQMRSREFTNIASESAIHLKTILTPEQLANYQKLEGKPEVRLLTERE